ncbi:MAG TPA: helix-turn-helix domain-containing protein [Devosia sp.]|jgi:DNA-binding transcriptional MerR regulator|uniref:MerR family transcriptional regulator n=1 Tax=Devosia sp. TaxID=1871048 RepID=UPI002DDDBC11|nr:helix-turn-helix domain-containing protein [Devosia sp.]HEV2515622.1 helix-turn-helix domain-containing protein [Devosia sp.]
MNLPIGELSRRTGVKVPTIRFYEQIGLLSAPPRTEGNQRRYGKPEVERLNFIRHSRELGFEVEDIRELLEMAASPQASCHQADSIARNHLTEIDRRIASLTALRGELTRMVEECGHGRICDCRIIEVLADHGECVTEHTH